MISTGNTVIPRLQSFLGQLGGLNPDATVLASPQDGESVLHSGDGSTAAAQREGTQRLKTELLHISFDLEAVLDDFLHVDFRHGAIDHIKALALTDEPITASTLTA